MSQSVDIYRQNGYLNRDDYLACLSSDYGIDLSIVESLADLLGSSEDFDGLVLALEDMEI